MTATGRTPRAAVYRDAVVRLAGHQKTAKGAPAYSRFVNRRAGRHLAALAHAWGWTPNAVTVLSSCFTFSAIAAVALLRPTPLLGVVVSLGLLLGYALDSADGQLARLRGGGSPSGEWLDHVIDAAKTASIHAAVLISFYRFEQPGAPEVLLVPLVAGVVGSVWFFAVVLTDQLRRGHAARLGTPVVAPGAPAPVLRSLLALPSDYGVLCLVFALLGVRPLFLAGYSALVLANVLVLALALRAWYRELESYGRPDDRQPVLR